MNGLGMAFRRRLPLFLGLAALAAVDAGILVAYRGFYDDRVSGLVNERTSLEARAQAAREALAKVEATENELVATRDRLEAVFSGTFGTRKERLARAIEEIYAITRKSGFRPDSVGFSETEQSASESLDVTFQVSAPYPEIKRLLAAFEASGSFLVLKAVSVSLEEQAGDALNVSLTVTHHFRAEQVRIPKRIRAPRAPVTRAPRRAAP